MPARLLVATLAFLLPLTTRATRAADEAMLVLKGFDPVELIDGREVEGDEAWSATHGTCRYRFVSEDNRDLFLSDPERWGVQWDGACGRMGPLSGRGAVDRFAVWNDRIWLFASDACRTGFLKAPEKLQPLDEAPPEGDAAAQAAGRALLDKAAAACGDAAALDALTSIHLRQRLAATSGGATSEGTRDVWLAFPGRYRFEESWGGQPYGHALSAGAAKQFDRSGEWALGPVSTTAAQRDALHHPLWLLRERANVIAVPAGTDTIDGQPVELVTVHAAKQNVTVALDAKSGRLVELRWSGLTARGIAPIVARVTEWRPVGKLVLPVRVQTVAAGGLEGDYVAGETMVELDVALDEKLFAPPAR